MLLDIIPIRSKSPALKPLTEHETSFPLASLLTYYLFVCGCFSHKQSTQIIYKKLLPDNDLEI